MMTGSLEVKICGLTREVDMDLALDCGADFCGFIVYAKSLRGLPLERAAELAKRVRNAKSVLVDVETNIEDLKRYRDAGFDRFQIHSGLDNLAVDSDYLPSISDLVGRDRLWLAPRLAPGDEFPEHILPLVDTVMIDTFHKDHYGGTGETGDWEGFADLTDRFPEAKFLLSGGLKPENVIESIKATGADRIDLSSGVESEPGIKNPEKLRELFGALKSV